MKDLTQEKAQKIIYDVKKVSTSAYCVEYDSEKNCFYETNMTGKVLYEFSPKETQHAKIVLELVAYVINYKKSIDLNPHQTFKLTKTMGKVGKSATYSITPKGSVSKRISQDLYELLFEKCHKIYQRTLHPRLTSEHEIYL